MSHLIRIISKKIINSKSTRISFIEYTNELSQSAKTQEGFIKSDSYWETSLKKNYQIENSNNLVIVSISEWENLSDWNEWYNSEKRNNINSKYKNIIEKEKFSILKKKLINDDVFLL